MQFEDIENLFQFIGGIGLFLYGMNIMADGLQKTAGSKMRQLMGYLTNNRFVAILVGALVTAIIQSSSATTVMVVGFVNAGIMTLTQAVGVIFGANIGTTITAWIVSLSSIGSYFSPELLAPLVVGIGSFLLLFAKTERKKSIGGILVGFGTLFIGLSFMSGAIKAYRDAKIFVDAFRVLGGNPILGILTGAIVTGIIQSSSASVGILQTLALNGVVGWNSAVYITLGQNIGTCVTALISSTGATKTAKRAAVIHLLFNVTGAIIFGILATILFAFLPEFAGRHITAVEISIFHTIFNISNTLILLPFADKMVALSGIIVKDQGDQGENESEETATLRHLDDRILETPSFAVENAVLEVVHMGNIALENMHDIFDCIETGDSRSLDPIFAREKTINTMEKLITEYLVKISNLSLTEEQHNRVNNLFYSISDIERIGDHVENLAELTEYLRNNQIAFSKEAQDELKDMMDLVSDSLESAIKAREKDDLTEAQRVSTLEDEVDSLEEELREKHITRLSRQLCKPQNGVVFLDMLSNLERMSDHSYNLAGYIMEEQE